VTSPEQLLPYIATAVVFVILTLVCVAWYVVDANETLKRAERLNEKSVEATLAATTIETAFLALTEKTTYLSAVADRPMRVRITDWWGNRFNRSEPTPDWAPGEILAMPQAQLEVAPVLPAWRHLDRSSWPVRTVSAGKAQIAARLAELPNPAAVAARLANLPDPTRSYRVQRSF
jgi:hypothetical protein